MENKAQSQEASYYKILVGLLVLTAVTLVQPSMFLTDYTMSAQLFIALIKAWLIVMYYMHLKGEKLIGTLVVGTLFIVSFFFVIILGFDVTQFQYQDVSPITKDAYHAASITTDTAHAVSHH